MQLDVESGLNKKDNILDRQQYENVYNVFLSKTNAIVESYLLEHAGKKWHPYSGEKVIHDPIWGSVRFTDNEMKIIDTPLFQRLRDIYQVGLGVFTYPSARHSRFEHSLGTVAIAAKMIEGLKKQKGNIVNITDYDVLDVRFAALLHDIGHCFYSHLSETYYSAMPEFTLLLRHFNLKFKVRPKAHEVFSFLIINTLAFKNFITENNVFDDKYIEISGGIGSLMNRIGNMIIGVANNGRGQLSNKSMSFLTRIINGDIDADKLDYIRRDSYTSGLPLTFDIERLLYKMTIREPLNTNEYQLVVDIAGITAVEEIVFSKLMLNHYIYHHQKVLATEIMAKDIALALIQLKHIEHPTDFLLFTDANIDALISSKETPFKEDFGCVENIGFFVKRVKNRYLPKRCFEINSHVLETVHSDADRNEQERFRVKKCLNDLEKTKDHTEKTDLLYALCSDLFEFTDIQKRSIAQFEKFINKFNTMTYMEYTKGIRTEIYSAICDFYHKTKKALPELGISVFDVHVSVPKTIKDPVDFTTPIVYRDNHSEAKDIMSYTKNWAMAFNSNKWSGYVFVSPHIDVTIAFKATLTVLKKHIEGMTFTHPDKYIKRLDQNWIEKIDNLL
ncbi:MAG: HD domain-containing protein [Oscillospiraceae bacterium]|jgi:HD superfamily phosphohydrolase|nr:HD domain-containing protein [Oscillospiraceae bacterium]